ncbi:MAG: transposase domain protein [Caballeronia mineralivorans]|nr:transposase domain protein [Caballeronia mineralivorans]
MDAFVDWRDPRCRTCRYPLPEILFAALSTVLCGVEDWEASTPCGPVPTCHTRTVLPRPIPLHACSVR